MAPDPSIWISIVELMVIRFEQDGKCGRCSFLYDCAVLNQNTGYLPKNMYLYRYAVSVVPTQSLVAHAGTANCLNRIRNANPVSRCSH